MSLAMSIATSIVDQSQADTPAALAAPLATPFAAQPRNATIASVRNKIVGNQKQTPAETFDEISRKLLAGPLTVEYLVAYQIEAYSKRH